MFNINNNKKIGSYYLKDIKDKDYITLSLPLDNETLNSLKYLNNKINIILTPKSNTFYDELSYFNQIKDILPFLKKNKYNLTIKVNNRSLLKESNLLNIIPSNINLSISTTDNTYNITNYLKEEAILDSLINPIKNANLSPFESYLATYDIVKNYKKYHSNEASSKDGTTLKEVLDNKNDYMVCAGFAKLLTELLNRLNIPSTYISLSVDTSYDTGYTQEDIPLNMHKHARNIIKIDDAKYNIHGYYLADSTWDNSLENNFYQNSILTFDRKKEAKRLESLEDEDLLLDFHNEDEFNQKINYFIKKRISHPKVTPSISEELLKKAYISLYTKILELLSNLDKDKYNELYSKYKKLLSIDLSNTTSNNLLPIINSLLKDYSKYIIPLSNNEIDNNDLVNALTNIHKYLYHEDNNTIKNWLEKIISENNKRNNSSFPYNYNPDNQNPAYLEERPKTK